ncbi:MAG: tetratricopeptide repeat protein [Terriglobia bacterium]
MRKLIDAVLLAGCLSLASPLAAQLNCTVVVNSPEDQLMLAVNGADNPQDQVAALDKYAQAHADSAFMPCVNSSYTSAYLKLNNFDKAIEYGEKDFAANTADINVMLNLLRAYVGAGKASDTAFNVINKVPDEIKKESNPGRPAKMSDADWQKAQQDFAEQTKDERAYGEYAFFQLLPRVTDPTKQIQFLDSFMTSYPDTPNIGQVNFQYFVAYKRANNAAKADEYGEKSIASDPNNVATLNLVADDYATRQTNLDKASEYATKVLQLAPAMKKPDGMTDADFKTNQNNQLGLAHTTLGYIAFLKAGKTRKVAPAIQEFKTAVDLLGGNPELQGKALYFLGSAYEFEYPPNHKAAADALGRVTGPWQGQAQGLLAKVKKAEHR